MDLIQQLEKEQFDKLAATKSIPEILQSGDHAKVAKWRLAEAEALTQSRRPELWAVRPVAPESNKRRKRPKNTTDG